METTDTYTLISVLKYSDAYEKLQSGSLVSFPTLKLSFSIHREVRIIF